MMGFNVITAIVNIVNYDNTNLDIYNTKSKIRINTVGERLEYYVKDAIANSFLESSPSDKKEIHSKVFSWLGNQNNPPDIIIKKGDAFEVKKRQSLRTAIALNNSYPKNRLYKDDPKITEDCSSCEDEPWVSKDIFYVMGCVNDRHIKHLFFVHGECLAAKREIYSNLLKKFKMKVNSLVQEENMEAVKTREVGRIISVDPLGITTFRIRGMWEIKNPFIVYDDLNIDPSEKMLTAIMLDEKYFSYPEKDRKLLEKHPKIEIKSTKIPNPNNPAKLLNVKLISDIQIDKITRFINKKQH